MWKCSRDSFRRLWRSSSNFVRSVKVNYFDLSIHERETRTTRWLVMDSCYDWPNLRFEKTFASSIIGDWNSFLRTFGVRSNCIQFCLLHPCSRIGLDTERFSNLTVPLLYRYGSIQIVIICPFSVIAISRNEQITTIAEIQIWKSIDLKRISIVKNHSNFFEVPAWHSIILSFDSFQWLLLNSDSNFVGLEIPMSYLIVVNSKSEPSHFDTLPNQINFTIPKLRNKFRSLLGNVCLRIAPPIDGAPQGHDLRWPWICIVHPRRSSADGDEILRIPSSAFNGVRSHGHRPNRPAVRNRASIVYQLLALPQSLLFFDPCKVDVNNSNCIASPVKKPYNESKSSLNLFLKRFDRWRPRFAWLLRAREFEHGMFTSCSWVRWGMSEECQHRTPLCEAIKWRKLRKGERRWRRSAHANFQEWCWTFWMVSKLQLRSRDWERRGWGAEVFNRFQRTAARLVGLCHAKYLIERKSDYAAIMGKKKIITFLNGTRNRALLRHPPFQSGSRQFSIRRQVFIASGKGRAIWEPLMKKSASLRDDLVSPPENQARATGEWKWPQSRQFKRLKSWMMTEHDIHASESSGFKCRLWWALPLFEADPAWSITFRKHWQGRSDFPLLTRILAGRFSGLRDRFGSSQMLATMRYWSYDLVSIGAGRGNEILSLATFWGATDRLSAIPTGKSGVNAADPSLLLSVCTDQSHQFDVARPVFGEWAASLFHDLSWDLSGRFPTRMIWHLRKRQWNLFTGIRRAWIISILCRTNDQMRESSAAFQSPECPSSAHLRFGANSGRGRLRAGATRRESPAGPGSDKMISFRMRTHAVFCAGSRTGDNRWHQTDFPEWIETGGEMALKTMPHGIRRSVPFPFPFSDRQSPISSSYFETFEHFLIWKQQNNACAPAFSDATSASTTSLTSDLAFAAISCLRSNVQSCSCWTVHISGATAGGFRTLTVVRSKVAKCPQPTKLFGQSAIGLPLWFQRLAICPQQGALSTTAQTASSLPNCSGLAKSLETFISEFCPLRCRVAVDSPLAWFLCCHSEALWEERTNGNGSGSAFELQFYQKRLVPVCAFRFTPLMPRLGTRLWGERPRGFPIWNRFRLCFSAVSLQGQSLLSLGEITAPFFHLKAKTQGDSTWTEAPSWKSNVK